MQSSSSANPPGQHRTRVHGRCPQAGARSATKSGRTGRSNPNARKDRVKPVVVIQQRRKEESVSNGYAGIPQHLPRPPHGGGYHSSSRKAPSYGRGNGNSSENLVFYPSKYRKPKPPSSGRPSSPKCTPGHKTMPAKHVSETKMNGCVAKEQPSVNVAEVVPDLSVTSVGVKHPMRTERCSTSVDSGRGDETCCSDNGSTGSVADTVTMDMHIVTTENTHQHTTESITDVELNVVPSSAPLLSLTSCDKDDLCECHAEDEFLDALSYLGDNDQDQEGSSLPGINSESSTSSSAFATPATCSGTVSPPATLLGSDSTDAILANMLEKKLLGLVSNCSSSLNGFSIGSDQDHLKCSDQEGLSRQQFTSLLIRAGSDSGVEELQYHEDESCTDASVILSEDLSVTCNGRCTTEERTLSAKEERTLSAIGEDSPSVDSLSHERDDSDLSADIGSVKSSVHSAAGLSDLQQPFQLISGASSPGDSFCSTSISSPAPSSPSPPPPHLPSHSVAKAEGRQPVCMPATTAAGLTPTPASNEVAGEEPVTVAGQPGAPLPMLVHCDSAPVFPSLPSPLSPAPTAAPVQHSLSKYPLQNTWVLWYFTSTKPHLANYAADLQHLSSVCHVEEFWSVFNNILYPSELANNSDYHFFKKGIRPLWEDPANKHGGRWVLTIKNNTQRLDNVWLEILMALIGEHITKSHYISGVVASRRKKGDRVALWTTDKKPSINLHICKQFLRVLALACDISPEDYPRFVQDLVEDKQGMTLVYAHHQDSLRSGSSYQSRSHVSLRNNLQFLQDSSQ